MVLSAIGINFFNKQSSVFTYIRKRLIVRETCPNVSPRELFNFLLTTVLNTQKPNASIHQLSFLAPSIVAQSKPRPSYLYPRVFTKHFLELFGALLGDSTIPSSLKKFSH